MLSDRDRDISIEIDPKDLETLKQWVGRQEVRYDEVTVSPIKGLSATLNCSAILDNAGYGLPPLWHWLYFLPLTQTSDLGVDGHAKVGTFLPPVSLPRRMWAGGEIEFLVPVAIGDAIKRVSTIADVKSKIGASGELFFVSVNHDIYSGEQLAIRERQDLVYCDLPRGGVFEVNASSSVPTPLALWSRIVEPTPALLFRYSALTFNAHRIHYDRDYATNTEGYADLVVHGPLVATLLLNLLQDMRPRCQLKRFSFRGIKPLLAAQPFSVEGNFNSQVLGSEDRKPDKKSKPEEEKVFLWAKDYEGQITMKAEATIEVESRSF